MKSELYSLIIDVLQRNNGKMLDVNLIDSLRVRGANLTASELRKALMRLEILGKVRVFSLDEERKVIELV